MSWPELSRVIAENESFLISAHASPDGDSIGSQLAFAWYLRTLEKNVVIFNVDPVPYKFHFLDRWQDVVNTNPERIFDVLIVLDSSNPGRLGWDGYVEIAPVVVNIDHHSDNSRFGDFNFIDDSAAATGQLLYSFFKHEDVSMSVETATSLYIAIMTDTGAFRFSNTTSEVHRVCADLIDAGVNTADSHQKVYGSFTPNGMVLQSFIWSSLEFHFDGRVCVMQYPVDAIEKCGAVYGDSEGMADKTLLALKSEVGMLIRYSDTETHFSLRSRGMVDVGRLARKIPGGGGHDCAAGCTVKLPFAEAKAIMLEMVRKELP